MMIYVRHAIRHFYPMKLFHTAFFYSVLGLYVNAGTATFTTTLEKLDNKPVYHAVGEGHTNSNYDWIFKVRDRYVKVIF